MITEEQVVDQLCATAGIARGEAGSEDRPAPRWNLAIFPALALVGLAAPQVRDAARRRLVRAKRVMVSPPKAPWDAAWKAIGDLDGARRAEALAELDAAVAAAPEGRRTDDLLDATALLDGADRDRLFDAAFEDALRFPDLAHRAGRVATVTSLLPERLLSKALAIRDEDIVEQMFAALSFAISRLHLGAVISATAALEPYARFAVLAEIAVRVSDAEKAVWDAQVATLDENDRGMLGGGVQVAPPLPTQSADVEAALRDWGRVARMGTLEDANAVVAGVGRFFEIAAASQPTTAS